MAPKSKAQKMSLGDFLGDQTLGSWADEMEDQPLSYSRPNFSSDRRAVSSAAGFGDRFQDRERPYATRESLPLPTKPPYTAHLGNLPFDAEGGHIEEFFDGCEVTNVRIVEDKIERRPKGFGYVEFASLEGLKRALELNQTQFRGRNIKISVADPPKDRPEARELTDWTRKGPLAPLPQEMSRRASERGGPREALDMERGNSRRGGAPPFEGDGKVRDYGNWERKGPLSPIPGAEPVRGNGRVRPAQDGPRERKNSPSWGGGDARSQDGSRPPREFRERPPPVERQPTAAELDSEWRTKMRPDAPAKAKSPTPETSTPSSPRQAPPALASRPKLNLAKRTVSEADPQSAAASSDSKSSPFGAAKPINTAAREKEIEEKRQLAIDQKRDADEKAREEKKAKEAEAKAGSEKTEDPSESGQDEKTKEGERKSSKTYQILARKTEEENSENNEEASEDNAKPTKSNGVNDESRPAKPRGPPRGDREPPRGPRNASGSWRGRNKPSNPNSAASPRPESQGQEDDGWSTVGPTKGRGQRTRGGGGRTGGGS